MLELDKRAFPPSSSLLNCILYFLLDEEREREREGKGEESFLLVLLVRLTETRPTGRAPLFEDETGMLMSMLNREERKWYSTGADQRIGYYLCSIVKTGCWWCIGITDKWDGFSIPGLLIKRSRHLINRVVFLCPIYLLFVIILDLLFFLSQIPEQEGEI